ncbi:hypothetical protein [Trichodesmium erythraeum]|uniref:hypothetical protein n=1 Tax=Trichodesmium erythraeum TaxID=1206 RepID=UPI00003C9C87|nr:hypothetical protein [Trichodesmium erythraeum GBRTRLIN201]
MFSDHSKIEGNTGLLTLKRDKNNQEINLNIEEILATLTKAINNGLKLAIFNSCDGLGLAKFIQNLTLLHPSVIVC